MLSKLVKASFLTGLVRVANLALGVLSVSLLAKFMGAESFGAYTFYISIVTAAAMLCRMGMPQYLLREVAGALQSAEYFRVRQLIKITHVSALIASVAVMVIAYCVIDYSPLVEISRFPYVLGLLIIPLSALGSLRQCAIRGLGHTGIGQLPESIFRPALLVVFVVVYFNHFAKAGQDYVALVVVLYVVSAVLSLLLGTLLLRTVLLKIPSSVCPAERLDKYSIRTLFLSSGLLGFVSLMQQMSDTIDFILLGFLGAVSDIGVYRLMVVGASLIAIGLQAVNIAAMPNLAATFAKSERTNLTKIVRNSARLSLLLTLFAITLLWLFGEQAIVMFFGLDFTVGISALWVLALMHLAKALLGPSVTVLMMCGEERRLSRGLLIIFPAGLILKIALISYLGIIGAAYGACVTGLLLHGYAYALARRYLAIDTMPVAIFRRPT